MKIAIHQPNFIPWIGFFDKINSVDKFVLFDHVQVSRGKSWFNRNRIQFNQDERWITMPIRKVNFQKIRDVEINYDSDFIKSHLGILKQEYGKFEYFNYYFDFLQELYNKREKYLIDFNQYIIEFFCQELQIQVEFVSSSELVDKFNYLQELKGNVLVLELCRVLDCKVYVSGTGCKDFILPDSFEDHQIKFAFQQFHSEHFKSESGNYLSILDDVFRHGPNSIIQHLNENYIDY